jgi:hypothetical protein
LDGSFGIVKTLAAGQEGVSARKLTPAEIGGFYAPRFLAGGVLDFEREESYSSFWGEWLLAGSGMTVAGAGVEVTASESSPDLVEDELPVSDAVVCI